MPVGTVRGRVELDAPALRTLKELERQGIRTEAQFKALGRETDSYTKSLVKLDVELEHKIRDLEKLRRQGERTMRSMRDTWTASTQVIKREVDAQQRSIRELEGTLDHLGARHATASVDVDGIALALTQVELLDERLSALGRVRATPRVALGGGFSGSGSGMMRNAATSMPRLPRATNSGGFPSGRPAGGGKGLRSVGVGPLNFGSASGLALIGGALPAVQSLIGGAAGIVGSAGMGLAGAGAVGAVGAGGLAAGVGGLVSLIKPMTKPIQDAAKAQANYNLQVQEYGRVSTQARVAKMKLDVAMKNAPRGTRDFLRERTALRTDWAKATRPGQESLLDLGIHGTRDLRRFARRGGAASVNRIGAATDREGRVFEDFITGSTGQRFARQGAGIFDENLGNVRQSGQNVFTTWTNLMQAARPFFKEGTDFLKRWTGGWAKSSGDIASTREKIGVMVDDFKQWSRLTGDTWRLLKDIGEAGAPSGNGLVSSLDETFKRWDDWIKRNPAQVQAFFRRSEDSTRKLASAFAAIGKAVSQLATQLTPLLDRFSTLASLAGGMGLLTPGVGSLVLGGLGAVRGGGGRRGGGGGGGGGGFGLLPFMGGGGGGGGGAVPAGGGVATSQGAGAFGLSALYGNWRANSQLRGMSVAGDSLATRSAARAALIARGAQGLTLQGAFANRIAGSTYGLARGFGYGRAASAAAQAGAIGTTAATVAGRTALTVARGALRRYLPIGLAFGALDAAGYHGSAAGKLQAGISSLSLGAVSRPQSASAGSDAGYQLAEDQFDPYNRTMRGVLRNAYVRDPIGGDHARARMLRRYAPHYVPSAIKASIPAAMLEQDAIDRRLTIANNAYGRMQSHGGPGHIFENSTALPIGPGGKTVNFTGDAAQPKLEAYIKTLHQERDARSQLIAGLQREKNLRASAHGGTVASQLQRGYQRDVKRHGQTSAFETALSSSQDEYGHLGSNAAKRGFAAQQLPFLRDAAKGNKAMEDEYAGFEKRVIRHFHGLADHIAVINGQIKVGAAGEWGSIADAIANAARSGVDRTSTEFARLKSVAIGALESMGFGHRAAEGIFKLQGGTATTRGQAQTVLRSGPGSYDAGIAAGRNAGPLNPHVSRHSKTGDGFGSPDARDANTRGATNHGRSRNMATNSGSLMGAKAGLGVYEKIGERYGLHVSSGARPGAITASGNVSLHSSGDAIDEVGSAGGMLKYARFLAQKYGSGLDELIHTPLGYGIKNGRRVPLSFWGAKINAMHEGHVHVGDRTPPAGGPTGGVGGAGSGGVGGAAPHVRIRSRASGLAGVPGALADSAGAGIARGMEAVVNRALAAGGGGGGRGAMTFAQVARLAESVGLPGVTFAQIAHGESGYNPRAVGHDPGGTQGLGLWQITTGFNDDIIARFGGRNAMFNPRTNALAAKAIYDRAGIGAWYGTRYLTGNNLHYQGDGIGHEGGGGGRGYLGAFRRGGHFVTRKGRGGLFVAGEGPNREEVIVRPHRPRGRSAHRPGVQFGGAPSVSVSVTMGHVTIREKADIRKVADEIGEKVGKKFLAALHGADETELMD